MSFTAGETVIITRVGPRFGATATIQTVTVSPDTGLDLITIDGHQFYADELMVHYAHREWDTAAGQAMEPIADLARLHGWAVHRTCVDAGTWRFPTLDMISPANNDGISIDLHATQPLEGRWVWSVWTHDRHARVIAGPHHGQGADQDIAAIIRLASDTGCPL